MYDLMAQVTIRTWGVADMLIAVIIVAAIVAIVCIALRAFGTPIPNWVTQVIGVLVVAFVCIMAIKLLLMM